MQLVPLVWAYTDGIRLIGTELAAPASVKFTLVRAWTDQLCERGSALTFFAGRHPTQELLSYVMPVATSPSGAIARSRSSLIRLRRSGVAMAWLSASALIGTAVYEAVAYSILA